VADTPRSVALRFARWIGSSRKSMPVTLQRVYVGSEELLLPSNPDDPVMKCLK